MLPFTANALCSQGEHKIIKELKTKLKGDKTKMPRNLAHNATHKRQGEEGCWLMEVEALGTHDLPATPRSPFHP